MFDDPDMAFDDDRSLKVGKGKKGVLLQKNPIQKTTRSELHYAVHLFLPDFLIFTRIYFFSLLLQIFLQGPVLQI
jgi:hypothetical protein